MVWAIAPFAVATTELVQQLSVVDDATTEA